MTSICKSYAFAKKFNLYFYKFKLFFYKIQVKFLKIQLEFLVGSYVVVIQ